ncbi:MAG TPA: hypothetical protein VGF59_09630 [Bryobacteraceae bacterium]
MKIRAHQKAGGDRLNHTETVVAGTGKPSKTSVRAGRLSANHNETAATPAPKRLATKTRVRAGAGDGKIGLNHCEAIAASKDGIRVKTRVQAGGLRINHNETVPRRKMGLGVKSRVNAGGHNLNHNEALIRKAR